MSYLEAFNCSCGVAVLAVTYRLGRSDGCSGGSSDKNPDPHYNYDNCRNRGRDKHSLLDTLRDLNSPDHKNHDLHNNCDFDASGMEMDHDDVDRNEHKDLLDYYY